ncbi:hypothetical protein [Aquabacterium sp.]|uniref:hypothetical protein n=1 Tax=Aquabacterium sp. TaxID=1872578 RepID=UPI0039C88D2F
MSAVNPSATLFFRYSQRNGLRRLALPPVSMANSICFSPDGGTMYFTDSLHVPGCTGLADAPSDDARIVEPVR